MESTLRISAPSCFASANAKVDFPDAVGPRITTMSADDVISTADAIMAGFPARIPLVNLFYARINSQPPLAQSLFEVRSRKCVFVSKTRTLERRPQMALPTRVSRSITMDPFESAQRELNTGLSRFFGGRELGDGGQGGW